MGLSSAGDDNLSSVNPRISRPYLQNGPLKVYLLISRSELQVRVDIGCPRK